MADPREAFLRAIMEDPDDDTPRLVFADWLEDHGEPERAEFIRIECELPRRGVSFERSLQLIDREQELRREWLSWWITEDVGRRVNGRRSTFERGFLMTLQLPGATLLVTKGQVLRRAPLRHLIVTTHALHLRLARTLLDAPPCLRRLYVSFQHSETAATTLLRETFGDKLTTRRRWR